MGYSDNDLMVRVDFFKESGKWYTTEAVKWLDGKLIDDFIFSLVMHLRNENGVCRLRDMIAVCLENNNCGVPLMIKVSDAIDKYQE